MKTLKKKDAKVPMVNQIDEFIYDKVPFIFFNPFIVGLQELYLNSYMEEIYDDMKVDLGTWKEYKQQIPKNWKTRKKKDNPRDLDVFVPRSRMQEHLSKRKNIRIYDNERIYLLNIFLMHLIQYVRLAKAIFNRLSKVVKYVIRYCHKCDSMKKLCNVPIIK